MNTKNEQLDVLQDIHNIMERSSRFISLSGLSGVSAGICALIGAFFGNEILVEFNTSPYSIVLMRKQLLIISAVVFISALLCAFFFTYLRSKKTGVDIWGSTAKRMIINISIPLLAGGLFIIRLLTLRHFGLLAPACLIVYGIALFCGSQQSTKEIRYLAISEMILGCISLLFLGKGLLFWAIGFGLLHIIYGTIMWFKYERK